jgi:hypothetical protein
MMNVNPTFNWVRGGRRSILSKGSGVQGVQCREHGSTIGFCGASQSRPAGGDFADGIVEDIITALLIAVAA